jgi:hypothetical protein
MKALRSIRYLTGGLLLLTGVIKSLEYLTPGRHGGNLSTILLLIIAGCCVLAPGHRNLRHLIGAGLLVLFFVVATSGGGLGPALLSMAFLIGSACMFSETLSTVAARPLTAIIDNIYFGNNPHDIPPLTLRLARAYRRDLRFEEAIQECERQLEYHPHSLDLWCEIIHNFREAGDMKHVQHYFRRARRRLSTQDRRQLDFEFQRYFQV